MRILISNDSDSAHFYERRSLARALVACGHDVSIWDITKMSAFDAFDKLDPEIFYSQAYNITPAIIECLRERPYIKTLFKAGDWGYQTEEIIKGFPILYATENEKRSVFTLMEEGLLGFLFVHHHQNWLNMTHGNWMSNGIQVESIMNAGDIFDYTNGEYKNEYESDICYVSGYWPYKAKILDKWLLPLCSDFKYNIKIFGNKPWPCPQYCGFCPDGEEKNVYKSSKICINLHEPHSHVFGYDVNERLFKLALNKCFCISDYVLGQELCYEGSVISAKKPNKFKEKIDYYLKNPNKRNENIEFMYKHTLENHTYFDRAMKIFQCLKLEDEAKNVINKKKEIFERMKL